MSWGRTALVVITTLVLQVCLFSRFSFEGARPDLMILLAVMAGYQAGPERGAIVGFASGLAFDLVLTTPLGLSAFVYAIVGYGVGVSTSGMVRTGRWIAPGIAAAGSAAGMVLYALIGSILGVPTLSGPSLAAIVVLVAAVNAAFAPVAARALAWARTDGHDRRQPFLPR